MHVYTSCFTSPGGYRDCWIIMTVDSVDRLWIANGVCVILEADNAAVMPVIILYLIFLPISGTKCGASARVRSGTGISMLKFMRSAAFCFAFSTVSTLLGKEVSNLLLDTAYSFPNCSSSGSSGLDGWIMECRFWNWWVLRLLSHHVFKFLLVIHCRFPLV